MRQHHRFSREDCRSPLLPVLLHWGVRLSIAASIPALSLGFQAERVQAYPRQTSVAVAQQQGDSYTALVRRAETAARTTAQQIFDSDILVSEVAVTVVGESGSAIVPILTMRVDRDQWRRRPDPQQWSTYFRTARSLLELGTPASSPPTVSDPVPAAPDSAPIAPSGTVSPAPPATAVPPIAIPAPGTIPPANAIPPANSSPPNAPAPNAPALNTPATNPPPANAPAVNAPAPNTLPAGQPTTPGIPSFGTPGTATPLPTPAPTVSPTLTPPPATPISPTSPFDAGSPR